jgi:hypothetical protein
LRLERGKKNKGSKRLEMTQKEKKGVLHLNSHLKSSLKQIKSRVKARRIKQNQTK